MAERGERRCKLLLDRLNETRRYWKLKKEAVDRTVRRTGCGRGCGPAALCGELAVEEAVDLP